MRQVFRKIPVYTGDVSGVCSALFELGGMVVMHDPSGCNSTYNTHDEIRWYDHDSLIFLSGLNDTDAMLGNDEKLIRDITEAARIYSPSFIAIANSPIPYIVGMDFDAITRIIEKETGIPSFYISTNGMHDYTRGAGLAFLQIAKRFAGVPVDSEKEKGEKVCKEKAENDHKEKNGKDCREKVEKDFSKEENRAGRKKIRVNLLGMTPLDFYAPSTEQSLRKKLASAGIEIVSNWAMDQDMVSDGRDSSSSISPISTDRNLTEDRTEAEELVHAPKGGAESSADTPENGFSGHSNDNRYNQQLSDICRSASADVNLLLSSTGLPAAEYMKERFGIPFVAGIPACGTEELYFEAVRTAAETGENQFPFRERKAAAADGSDEKKPPVCLIGEPVVMTSLAASMQTLTGVPTHVFGMTEEGRGEPAGSSLFLGGNDFAPAGEEELNARLRNITGQSEGDASVLHAAESEIGVIADPCYEDAIPQGYTIIRLPHLAFSGRIFLREIPDLMDESVVSRLQSFLSGRDRDNGEKNPARN